MGELRAHIVLFSFLLFFINDSLSAYYNDNSVRTQADPIHFRMIQGLIVIEGKVNGQRGQFLLDSGAPSLMLNQVPAQADDTFIMVDRELQGERLPELTFEIGSYTATLSESWKVDLSAIEKRLGFEIDGLVGVDIFADNDVLVDFRNYEIYIVQKNKSYPVENWASEVIRIPFSNHNDNLPVLHAEYKGKSLKLAFDTGANHSVLCKNLKLPQNGKIISSLDFGDLSLKELPITSHSLEHFYDSKSGHLDGIIHASAFRADQIYISFRRGYIYFFFDKEIVAQR